MALPKLNLRDLFWLVVVGAMGIAWWLDHRSLTAEMNRPPDAIRNFGDKLPPTDIDDRDVH